MLNFIVNSRALRGEYQKIVRDIKEYLREEEIEFRIFFSERAGGVGKYAYSLSSVGQKNIIAVGGDGTLNEVVSNLVDPAACAVGLVPIGTGNDFAAAAGIPNGIAALDLIAHYEPVYTDYIECGEGHRSVNIAGLGIDVDILKRCARKKGGTRSKYFRSLIASLLTYRGLNLSVTVDGKTEQYRALIAAVCNGSQFGGGIRICPEAVMDDGVMELLVIECPKRLKIPRELVHLMHGRILSRPITHHIRCREALIVPEEPQTIQYDGELFPAKALDAKLVHGKLKMFRG